jgi:hypothetical protein
VVAETQDALGGPTALWVVKVRLRERAATERDWREAEAAIDDAERDVQTVGWRLRGQYGDW